MSLRPKVRLSFVLVCQAMPALAQQESAAGLSSVAAVPAAYHAEAQPAQYTSPAGVVYRSLPDTEGLVKARAAVALEPRNISRIIELGVAESGARQFREAIDTFTRGLEIEPDNALLLRWRGHRFISIREFDRARADLARAVRLDPSLYGAWFHLGVVQYLSGEFKDAAASFAKAQPIAPDPNELAGSTDWLWMSLSRAGRKAEAKAVLDRRSPTLPPDYGYTRRLQLYAGVVTPDKLLTAADTDGVQIATLSYGAGNWLLVQGDKAGARAWFERAVQTDGWPAFGFILAEAELRRLKPRRPDLADVSPLKLATAASPLRSQIATLNSSGGTYECAAANTGAASFGSSIATKKPAG